MFVIDASVALKWFLIDEQYSDESLRLLNSNIVLITLKWFLLKLAMRHGNRCGKGALPSTMRG